jgi:hypothetical protein
MNLDDGNLDHRFGGRQSGSCLTTIAAPAASPVRKTRLAHRRAIPTRANGQAE